MKKNLLILILCISTIKLCAQKKIMFNSATDWLSNAKIGAFMHFLPSKVTFEQINKFDVELLADQLSTAGAKYFIFSLGQNSGYFNAPNPVYDSITGYLPGERCSKRDLPMEIAKALKKKGIRFMLYLPCQTPNTDTKAVVAFGFPIETINKDRFITSNGAKNWASVIKYWSKHYKKLVSGWWFDGGYSWCGFNSKIAQLYEKAAKSGNHKAITTFNPGAIDSKNVSRATDSDDYIAGEVNNPFKYQPTNRWLDGSQMHFLTYMGNTWGQSNTRFQDSEWIKWLKKITSKGIAVTIDMGVNYNPEKGKVGSLFSIQQEQFKHLSKAIEQ